MRFRSQKKSGLQVFAVSGTNTISFGISATEAAKKGLLGFAVERVDPAADERYFMRGFKVFESVIPQPDSTTEVSTFEHPVQSLVWDDFTCKPGHSYTYFFHPLKGKPKNLNRLAPIEIQVATEPLYDGTATHQIFFNRGVASSQAYARRFGNSKPSELPQPQQDQALQWLSRDLDDAMLKFIDSVEDGDTLLCCFYEFRYPPVLQALRDKAKTASVTIIVDAKKNAGDFPRKDNLANIRDLAFPASTIIQREARTSAIQHNKFMVRCKGKGPQAQPFEVWTGSTNLSVGGIHGQTNVGHWVRDAQVAASFEAYWKVLSADPGGKNGEPATTVRAKNKAFKTEVAALTDAPADVASIPKGITPVFSPRPDLGPLDLYFELIDSASRSSAVTLAFGISASLKEKLLANGATGPLVTLLLEKKDSKEPPLTFRDNVYSAWGQFIETAAYQWVRETNARELGLNVHVSYIHSKFLLRDPLGADPIIVAGSANFSEASTNENDENMLIIRGDKRTADIYFTEFNRLWNHYYFRSILGQTGGGSGGSNETGGSLFLAEDDTWTAKYQPGKLRAKRLAVYTNLKP